MNNLKDEFIEKIKTAKSEQQSLMIMGAGTKVGLGRSVSYAKDTISTTQHRGIINYEPVELVMTARAGTSLAEIDAALEKNNQYLACDPARYDGEATIGGSLASNQAGPGRPWLGSLRDHVLGLNLINGEGKFLRFGGTVMKNVAGYDVSRLQAGAMGTLGLITEISFKVLPKPAASLTLLRKVDMEEAILIMNQLAAKPKPLSAACWSNGCLYLQLSGAKSAVENTAENWDGDVLDADAAQLFWSELRDQKIDFFKSRQANEPLWRFSLKSTASVNSSAITSMPFANQNAWLVDWAGSLRWLKGEYNHQQLHEWAQQQGGEVILYQGGDRSKELAYSINPVMKKIQKQLKHSFDPGNVFNIGRLYSWM